MSTEKFEYVHQQELNSFDQEAVLAAVRAGLEAETASNALATKKKGELYFRVNEGGQQSIIRIRRDYKYSRTLAVSLYHPENAELYNPANVEQNHEAILAHYKLLTAISTHIPNPYNEETRHRFISVKTEEFGAHFANPTTLEKRWDVDGQMVVLNVLGGMLAAAAASKLAAVMTMTILMLQSGVLPVALGVFLISVMSAVVIMAAFAVASILAPKKLVADTAASAQAFFGCCSPQSRKARSTVEAGSAAEQVELLPEFGGGCPTVRV